MRLKDELWTPQALEGHVKLELFDDRTGKLQERQEADNYVTDILTAVARWNARNGTLHAQLSQGGTSSTGLDPSPIAPCYFGNQSSSSASSPPALAFVLTDATNAENPSGDRILCGKVCAFAWANATYAGSDTFRGTLNQVESSRQSTKDIIVIDWPTNAGNGTIQSVYGTYLAQNNNASGYVAFLYADSYVQNLLVSASGYGDTWSDSQSGLAATSYQQQGLYLDPDGVSYWEMAPWNPVSGQATMLKRTLGTGVIVSTVVLTGMATSTATMYFTNDGTGAVGNWWVTNYNSSSGNNNLHKFAAAGGAPTTTYTGKFAVGGFVPITAAGGYLWALLSGTVQQLDPATGNLITTITLQAQPDTTLGPLGIFQQFITYRPDVANGDELWVSVGTTWYASRLGIGRYSLSGVGKGIIGDPRSNAWGQWFYQNGYPNGVAVLTGSNGWVFQSPIGSGNPPPTSLFRMNNSRQFVSRSLLPSAVTKANTQTMKLTYEFDWT